MGDRQIKELLGAMGFGESVPKMLMEIVGVFKKRKSAEYPEPFTMSDLVTCTMIYDLLKKREKPKDEKQAKETNNG